MGESLNFQCANLLQMFTLQQLLRLVRRAREKMVGKLELREQVPFLQHAQKKVQRKVNAKAVDTKHNGV